MIQSKFYCWRTSKGPFSERSEIKCSLLPDTEEPCQPQRSRLDPRSAVSSEESRPSSAFVPPQWPRGRLSKCFSSRHNYIARQEKCLWTEIESWEPLLPSFKGPTSRSIHHLFAPFFFLLSVVKLQTFRVSFIVTLYSPFVFVFSLEVHLVERSRECTHTSVC